FAVHSYLVVTVVPSRFASQVPISHSRSRTVRPSPGCSRARAISHFPSSRARRQLHRLTTSSFFVPVRSLKEPSTTAVSREGNRIDSISIAIALSGFLAKYSVYAFSRAARPRNVSPSSLTYSPSAVQSAASALPSPFANAAANASIAFFTPSRSAGRSSFAAGSAAATGAAGVAGGCTALPGSPLASASQPAAAAQNPSRTRGCRRELMVELLVRPWLHRQVTPGQACFGLVPATSAARGSLPGT